MAPKYPVDKNLSTTTNESGFVMTLREQVGLGFSAMNDLFGIFTSLGNGRMTSQGYNFQAVVNTMNAEMTRQDARGIFNYYDRQENIVREEGKRLRGEQRVAMGASGFDIGSKSYQGILDETDRNILDNTLYIREEAMNKYAAAMYQAKEQDIQAELNREAARITKKNTKSNALWSGLSAAAKIGSIAYFGER